MSRFWHMHKSGLHTRPTTKWPSPSPLPCHLNDTRSNANAVQTLQGICWIIAFTRLDLTTTVDDTSARTPQLSTTGLVNLCLARLCKHLPSPSHPSPLAAARCRPQLNEPQGPVAIRARV